METKSETIYAFIDSQNLKLSVRNSVENRKGEIIYNGWDLDFKRFFIYLQDKYRVDKAYLFIGRVAGNEALYSYLENIGYIVIYKPTLVYTEGKKKVIKGNLDAELVLHTMIEYPNFTKAMIVAGDGDYYCLVEYLESQNKLLNVFIPNKYKFSSLLRKYFKYFVYVSDLRGKLERV